MLQSRALCCMFGVPLKVVTRLSCCVLKVVHVSGVHPFGCFLHHVFLDGFDRVLMTVDCTSQDCCETFYDRIVLTPSLVDAIKMSYKKGPGLELASCRSSVLTLGSCRHIRTRRVLKTCLGSKWSRLFAGQYLSGSWLCNECGNLNYRNRAVCNLNGCQTLETGLF